MTKTRLEAFSDGVVAIIITIMVLELKIPHQTSWEALKPLIPAFLSYALSFVYLGIYWGNHHHLLHTVSNVNSKIIWANLSLLFCLSIIPFATGWMGENNFDNIPVAFYAALQVLCSIAYFILLRVILSSLSHDSEVLTALQKQSKKGIVSLIAYILSIPIALINPVISAAIFVLVAIMWWIPDRNIEKSIK